MYICEYLCVCVVLSRTSTKPDIASVEPIFELNEKTGMNDAMCTCIYE